MTNYDDITKMLDNTAASVDRAVAAAIRAEIAASDAYDRWEVLTDLYSDASYNEWAKNAALAVWAKRGEPVATRRQAYYDETDYIAPSLGFSAEQVRSALYAKWANSLTGSAVGGYVTPSVRDNGDGTLTVTSVYHLGD